MVYVHSRIRPGEWDVEGSLGISDTNRSPDLDRTTKPSDSQQKEIKLKKKKKKEREPVE